MYVLERLSSLHIGPLQSLTGAQPLGSLSAGLATPPSSLGTLKGLRQLTALGETYLQLEGVSDDHCSILLTSPLKTAVDEMTVLCRDTGEFTIEVMAQVQTAIGHAVALCQLCPSNFQCYAQACNIVRGAG